MAPADALLAACLADPDADLPRLAFADALDDAGDDVYGEFVRAQVALDAAPPWEPLAVRVRLRRPDLVTGERVRDRLPDTGNEYVRWAAEPFRRGLGWAVAVQQLADFLAVGDRLFEAAPVGELHLPRAPFLEDWTALAARPWMGRVRTLRFTATRLPIEPVRVFADAPGGVTALQFDQANSPAADDLFGDLARSPLGRQLEALHLRNGYPAGAGELVAELGAGSLRVSALSLTQIGLTAPTAERLAAGPLLDPVRRLDLTNNMALGDAGFQRLFPARPRPLEALAAVNCGLADGAVRWLCWAGSLAGLKALDLSNNPRLGDALGPLGRERAGAGLRSLALRGCRVGDAGVRHLTEAAFWPTLVELDLRNNEIGDAGARRLLAAAVPPDLAALRLELNPIGERLRAKLRAKFGEVVVFDG